MAEDFDVLHELSRSFNPSSPCKHPRFRDSTCTRCGRPKPECGDPETRPFFYIHPGLTMTRLEINRLRDLSLKTLTQHPKKLHLVVDLDNTLLHSVMTSALTLEDRARLAEVGEVFELWGGALTAKLRPGARRFLEEAAVKFELSVFTMGCWDYAREVARVLDPCGTLFGWRVMSRDDSVEGKQKSLDRVLVPERAVLIVDDKEEVWVGENRANIVKIARYEFFGMKKKKNKITKEFRLWSLFGGAKSSGGFRECEGKEIRDREHKEIKEFARVWKTLKGVHGRFFKVKDGDVRRLLEEYKGN